jgi:hypothetical protein
MTAMEKELVMMVHVYVIKAIKDLIALKDLFCMEKFFLMELLFVMQDGQGLLVMKNLVNLIAPIMENAMMAHAFVNQVLLEKSAT